MLSRCCSAALFTRIPSLQTHPLAVLKLVGKNFHHQCLQRRLLHDDLYSSTFVCLRRHVRSRHEPPHQPSAMCYDAAGTTNPAYHHPWLGATLPAILTDTEDRLPRKPSIHDLAVGSWCWGGLERIVLAWIISWFIALLRALGDLKPNSDLY